MPDIPDPLMAEFVERTGAPCPVCRAPLRIAPGDVCAACGEMLALGVDMADRSVRHLAAGAVGLALGFGFNTCIAIMLLWDRHQHGTGLAWGRLVPIFGGAPTLALALCLWFALRSRIRAAPVPTRRLLVVLCWCASAGFLFWLALNLRR